MPCNAYHAERNFIGKVGVCWGTKECEPCSCGGDESKCDFYAYVRERARPKTTNADKVRTMTDIELAKFFAEIGTDKCAPGRYDCCYPWDHCNECWLDWLKDEPLKENK